jgi:hypothetical protein
LCYFCIYFRKKHVMYTVNRKTSVSGHISGVRTHSVTIPASSSEFDLWDFFDVLEFHVTFCSIEKTKTGTWILIAECWINQIQQWNWASVVVSSFDLFNSSVSTSEHDYIMSKIWEHDHELWLHKDLGLKYPTYASARRDSNDTRHLKRDFRYPSRSSNRRPLHYISPCIYRYSSLLRVAFFVLQTWIHNCIIHSFIHFPVTNLKHRAPFGVSWSYTYRHTVGLLWTSDQPVAETYTYTGQHKRQTSMPRAGFEPATAATKQPQTYALDRAAHWDRHTIVYQTVFLRLVTKQKSSMANENSRIMIILGHYLD